METITIQTNGALTHLDARGLRLRGRCMKLSDQEVREIRFLSKEPMFPRKRISELYKVHTSTISDILTGKTRTDVV